ncbi:hypothetical protein ACBJ59_21595 [Nonomuraea sp. MTCD27]
MSPATTGDRDLVAELQHAGPRPVGSWKPSEPRRRERGSWLPKTK